MAPNTRHPPGPQTTLGNTPRPIVQSIAGAKKMLEELRNNAGRIAAWLRSFDADPIALLKARARGIDRGCIIVSDRANPLLSSK
jgi:hypothetical protein